MDREGRPRVVRALEYGAFAAVFLATTFGAYWAAFSTFQPWDDEGSHLETMRAFLSGASLYTDSYAYHGPFNFELFAVFYRFDPGAATTDAARIAVIGVWCLTALLAGVAVRRITSSIFLGVAAQIAWFLACRTLVNEPGHPLSAITIMLAVAGCAIAFLMPAHRRAGMVVLGVAAGLLAMTKINVGGLMVVAVLLAAAITLPRSRLLRVAAAAAAALFPLALMAEDLGNYHWRVFFFVITAGIIAVITAGWTRPERANPATTREWAGHFAAFAIAAAGASLACLLVLIATGSTPRDVIEGTFLVARHHRSITNIRIDLEPDAFIRAAVFLVTAIAAKWALSSGRLSMRLSALLRIAAGVLILFAVSGMHSFATDDTSRMLTLPASLAWVAALPPARAGTTPPAQFMRVAVAAIAVFQALHAYPVAASQVGPASVFFLFAAAFALRDGFLELEGDPIKTGLRHAIAVGVAVLLVLQAFVPRLEADSEHYHAGTALPFPGATLIHLPQETADHYLKLVRLLKQNCDAYVGLPHYASFNAWSGIPPVDDLIFNVWMPLFGREKQQSIVDALFKHRRPCAIRNQGQVDEWQKGKPFPQLPLVTAIDNMVTVARVGPYELMVPPDRVDSVEGTLLACRKGGAECPK